jgi:hypothetical protein
MELARKFNIKEYPAPAGGCLLTDPVFSRRLKDLMDNNPELNRNEIDLLKLGRHFRITPEIKVIVGRNMKENERILSLAGENSYIFNTVTIPGPVVYVSGIRSPETDMLAASMTVSYSDVKEGDTQILLNYKGEKKVLTAGIRDKSDFRHYMI